MRKIDIQETLVETSTAGVSSLIVIHIVISWSCNTHEWKINIQNPQVVNTNNEPANNIQVINEQVIPQEIALQRSVKDRVFGMTMWLTHLSMNVT